MNQVHLKITVLINLVLISQLAAAPLNLPSNDAVPQQVAAPFSGMISKNIVKREYLPPPLFEVEYVERHRGEDQNRKEQSEDKYAYNDGERNDHNEDDDDSDLVLLG
ncbi:uncharacterized protein LOC110675495 [Aedes aegypti]|uniref:Secreted protein n=1 Tax=Aedes aegypti TaxID=7159 RepID=A0A6I8TS96_AEDAE|nr:uncharacterized protein LOC110675495 [Aedes aegypti]